MRKSVFVKLLLGFLLVAAPMYGICLGVTWYGSKSVLESTSQTIRQELYFFTNYYEEELSNVNQMLVSLSMDSDLKEYALQRNQEFAYPIVISFEELMSKLKVLYFSSGYIDDVFMMLPKAGEVVSVLNGYNEMDDKYKTIYRDMAASPGNRLLYGNDVVYFSSSDNDFVLGVELSQDKIMASLKQHQGNEALHIFLKDNQRNALMAEELLTAEEKRTIALIDKPGADRPAAGTALIERHSYAIQETPSEDGLFTIGFYAKEKDLLGRFYLLRKLFWILAALSLIIIFAFSIVINKQIQVPVRLLVKSMKEVEKGNYNSRLKLDKDDEFGYMYKQFNRMAEQLQNLIREVLEKKIQFQQAQLKHLQSQINPHFLYNCFYNGYRMAKSGETENVAGLCKYLGDYFRFVTYYADRDAALADEIKYTRIYLEIQKIRFGDKLHFDIACDVDGAAYPVPGLILQPLVENAIIHGLERKEEPTRILIRIFRVNGGIRTVVEDDGPGFEPGKLAELLRALDNPDMEADHFGLWNINWRLRYRYGEDCRLTIRNGPGFGASVSFDFPDRPPNGRRVEGV